MEAEFRSFGQVAGSAIATVAKWLTKLIAIFTRITSGIIGGFRSMMEYIGPAFDTVGGALNDLKEAWNTLAGATGDSNQAVDESISAWPMMSPNPNARDMDKAKKLVEQSYGLVGMR